MYSEAPWEITRIDSWSQLYEEKSKDVTKVTYTEIVILMCRLVE